MVEPTVEGHVTEDRQLRGIMKPFKIKSKNMKLDDGESLPQSNEEKELKAIRRGGAGGLKSGNAKAKKPSAKK
jgi:hypothetical protein